MRRVERGQARVAWQEVRAKWQIQHGSPRRVDGGCRKTNAGGQRRENRVRVRDDSQTIDTPRECAGRMGEREKEREGERETERERQRETERETETDR